MSTSLGRPKEAEIGASGDEREGTGSGRGDGAGGKRGVEAGGRRASAAGGLPPGHAREVWSTENNFHGFDRLSYRWVVSQFGSRDW